MAVAPITSMPPAIATTNATVRLAAAPAPLEFYQQVAQRTYANAADLAHVYLSDPFPISRAVVNNQVAAVSNIVAAVESGDPAAVLTAVGEAVMQPIENAITAGGDVIAASFGIALSTISPALQVVASTAVALMDVFAAIASLDVIDLVNSVLDIPAHLANGVLNGGYPLLSPFNPVIAGILTPAGVGLMIPGPIAAVIALDQQVAEDISPVSAVSSAPARRSPAPGAATLRLNTAEPEKDSVSPDPAPDTAEPDTFRPAGKGPEPKAAAQRQSATSHHGHRGNSAARGAGK